MSIDVLDLEIERKAEQLAELLEARGYIVTRSNEVEASAVAHLLGISAKTLRNWRCELIGPPPVLIRGRAWYRLRDFVRWQDNERLRAGR